MTFEEYHYYSDIAKKLFDYMNGNINRMNSRCELYIGMYDYVHNTYANIRYPNFIVVHVGTIIDSWDDSWSQYMDKSSYIASCIAWAISHELHHADQLISMLQYNRNEAYKRSVEGDVERASYDWVASHSREISRLIGIQIVIRDIDSPSLPSKGNYTKASVEQFYKQTIANIVIRDMDLFNKLGVFTTDNCDDIVLNFNNTDKVVIKSNGEYLPENINIFSELAYKYAGYYDVYHINVTAKITTGLSGRDTAVVSFMITDNLIRPMIFK